jgi:hypothetical protein
VEIIKGLRPFLISTRVNILSLGGFHFYLGRFFIHQINPLRDLSSSQKPGCWFPAGLLNVLSQCYTWKKILNWFGGYKTWNNGVFKQIIMA